MNVGDAAYNGLEGIEFAAPEDSVRRLNDRGNVDFDLVIDRSDDVESRAEERQNPS